MIYLAIIVLLALAAVYILWPLRASSSTNEYSNQSSELQEAPLVTEHNVEESLAQLELERTLGQISEEEYQSSRDMIAAQSDTANSSSLQDNADESFDVEAEILIARARLRHQSQDATSGQGWTCASCSREMSASDKFCASCGAAQPQQATAAVAT